MKKSAGWKSLAALLVLLSPATGSAIGTVTHGDVTFGYTNNFNTSNGNTVDTTFTGTSPGDLAYESWWFFRVSGDRRETAFGTPDAEDYSLRGGSVGQLDWNDPGGAGLFSAILSFQAIDTGANSGVLFQNMEITNTSGAALTLDIFHYSDLDLASTFGGDSASVLPNPDGIEISITDGVNFSPMIGYDADAFQITGYNTLLRDLTDRNRDDMDNSGSGFGPGDVTAGFQWTRTFAAGDSIDFLTQLAGDNALEDPSISVVPEPGTALLMGLGLIGLARRREASCA